MLHNHSSDLSNRISQHLTGIRTATTEELLREADARIAELEKDLKRHKAIDSEIYEELSGVLGSVEAWLDPAPKQQTAVFDTMSRVKNRLEVVKDKMATRS